MLRAVSDVPFNENEVCEVCGKYGALAYDGRKLCAECYESSGSCCPEFTREEKPEGAEKTARETNE
jgi:hypothetical protein